MLQHRAPLALVVAICPKVNAKRTGRRAAARSPIRFRDRFGFLEQVDGVGVEGPPPFLPRFLRSLLAAIRPPGMACAAPSTVFTVLLAWKFWITPWLMNTTANTNESGEGCAASCA